MKTLNNLFSVLVGLALLAALIAGAFFAVRFVINLFTDLDAQVASIIYAASIAALFSAVIISAIVRAGQRQKSMEEMRPERAEVYTRFIEAWSYTLIGHVNAQEELQTAEKQLILWGSSNVIKQYTAYRKRDTQCNPRDPAIRQLIEKVIFEMRKDLGQSNFGLNAGDLFDLLLNGAHDARENNNTAPHAEREVRLPA